MARISLASPRVTLRMVASWCASSGQSNSTNHVVGSALLTDLAQSTHSSTRWSFRGHLLASSQHSLPSQCVAAGNIRTTWRATRSLACRVVLLPRCWALWAVSCVCRLPFFYCTLPEDKLVAEGLISANCAVGVVSAGFATNSQIHYRCMPEQICSGGRGCDWKLDFLKK